jgi:hypothetical protein
MTAPKNVSGGGIRSEHDAYAMLRGILPLWDMSANPRDNSDFGRKLGQADHIRGGAITKIDKDSSRNVVADGILNKAKVPSIFQMDPDSFALRLFPQNKTKYRGIWSVRLSVDQTAPDSSQGNRGTMVIDQNKAQQWAWLGDLLRVTEPNGGASIADKELMHSDAGYLALLYEEAIVGNASRGALALDISRNKGFASDGERIGQLSHILCFADPATPTQGGGGGGSTKVAERPKQLPRAEESDELLIRGDAGFRYGITVARFDPIKKPKGIVEGDGEYRLVELHFDAIGKPDDKLDTRNDANSNHDKVDKDRDKVIIKGHVKVPKGGGHCCHHYDGSYHSPPPWDPGSGSSSSGGGSSGYSPTSTGSGGKLPSSSGRNPSGNSAAPAPYGIGEPTPTVDPLFPGCHCMQHGFR